MGKSMIKVGFCVAYDWELLRYSIPLIYNEADVICLSIDKDRIGWGGKSFSFDERAFRDFVSAFDTRKIVTVLEDDFHRPELSPMENEVRQRNTMAAHMGAGGWHIQLDADEYFAEFSSFVTYLRSSDVDDQTNVCCSLITLFKKTENGYLFIDPQRKSNLELIAIACKNPKYEHGRRNGYFNHITNYQIVHQSWARDEKEIQEKVSNWGHKNDFDVDSFVQFWKQLNGENFRSVVNFHPIEPTRWPLLKLIESNTINELVEKVQNVKTVHFSTFELLMKNSKTVSRARRLLKIIGL